MHPFIVIGGHKTPLSQILKQDHPGQNRDNQQMHPRMTGNISNKRLNAPYIQAIASPPGTQPIVERSLIAEHQHERNAKRDHAEDASSSYPQNCYAERNLECFRRMLKQGIAGKRLTCSVLSSPNIEKMRCAFTGEICQFKPIKPAFQMDVCRNRLNPPVPSFF